MPLSSARIPTRSASRPSGAFPMLSGLVERLALSLALTGATFLGVIWALA